MATPDLHPGRDVRSPEHGGFSAATPGAPPGGCEGGMCLSVPLSFILVGSGPLQTVWFILALSCASFSYSLLCRLT